METTHQKDKQPTAQRTGCNAGLRTFGQDLQSTARPLRILSYPERWLAGIVGALLLLSLFYNLGVAPLRHEEPRRALIALEMLFNDNLLVPTEFGEYYYKKPPFHNWVILAGFALFGNYSEWAVRFLPLLSFVGMGALVFWMGRRYVSADFGAVGGLLTLAMADVLYYFSANPGEIDLFYSFVTLASFCTIFHFHARGRPYALFLATYLLGAVGTLTKGLPSVLFLGISLGAFFLYQRQFRRLFSLPHAAGLAVYVLTVGGYFYLYSQHNDPVNFLFAKDSLWSQASERTVLEKSAGKLLTHLLVFPFETLKNILPAALLAAFLFRRDARRVLLENRFVLFCLLMFAANVPVYWASPGTRSRYVYMLYPLLVTALTYAYFRTPSPAHFGHGVLRWAARAVAAGVAVAGLALPFVPVLQPLGNLWVIGLLTTAAATAVLFRTVRRPGRALLHLLALAAITRFAFAATVLPLRATTSGEAADKAVAGRLAALVGDTPLYMHGARVSRTTVFYLERARGRVLSFDTTTRPGAYYLVDLQAVPDRPHRVHHTFTDRGYRFGLLTFP